MGRWGRTWAGPAAVALLAAACSDGAGSGAAVQGATRAVAAGSPAVTAAPAPVVAEAAPTTSPAPAPAPPPPTAPPPTVPARAVVDQAWTPFATVQGVVLTHPSNRVERVGFHESNHDGARALQPAGSAVAPVTLEGRERGTAPMSAADVVVDPGARIRAVATGRVKRAGRYVLYCRYTDHFLVIAPDGQPGWEVKMLHIGALRVRPGDRVAAGETVVAVGPTQLPFESQVDELAPVAPAWPHVHIEVVDPSIPDRPTPGGGCS